MALPGTPGQRISDLCNGNHITQKELAEKIGVSASQLSRIVSGETRTVSSDILIGVAGEHEAEIEKIKNVFLAILRDIKKDIDNGEQPGEAVTAAMFQAMRDALAEQKQKPLSIDDVTAMIAGQIGQLAPMDEETADLFKQLAKKMMKGIE